MKISKILVGGLLVLGMTSLISCAQAKSDESTKECDHDYGQLVLKVDSTCSETGHEAYYLCAKCNQYFNENKEKVEFTDLIIAAKNHNYGAPEYTWDVNICTAKVMCLNDSSHVITETSVGEFVEDTTATCETNSLGHYHAEFENTLFSSQNTEENSVVGEKSKDHNYGTPEYIWNDNICTALAVCKENSSHILKEIVTGEFVEDTPATCEEKQKGHFHAVFVSSIFIPQDTEMNSAIGENEKGHQLELIEGQDSTHFEDGWKSYYQCTVCKKYFEDSEGLIFIADIEEWKITTGKIGKTSWSNPV